MKHVVLILVIFGSVSCGVRSDQAGEESQDLGLEINEIGIDETVMYNLWVRVNGVALNDRSGAVTLDVFINDNYVDSYIAGSSRSQPVSKFMMCGTNTISFRSSHALSGEAVVMRIPNFDLSRAEELLNVSICPDEYNPMHTLIVSQQDFDYPILYEVPREYLVQSEREMTSILRQLHEGYTSTNYNRVSEIIMEGPAFHMVGDMRMMRQMLRHQVNHSDISQFPDDLRYVHGRYIVYVYSENSLSTPTGSKTLFTSVEDEILLMGIHFAFTGERWIVW